MTNQEAINVLFNEWKCIDRNDGIHCDRKCESCDLIMDVGIIREAFNKAIFALQEQEAKAQLPGEGTTPKVKKTCITCKHYPPESKWPCIDCDMRNPADRWEPQELANNSPKLDKENGDMQPTCNELAKDTNVPCKDTISRQAAIDAIYKCTDIYINNLPIMIDKAEAYKAISELPSAQHEILRCKDCIKREICRTSTTWAVAPKDDWYCADAERRIDE